MTTIRPGLLPALAIAGAIALALAAAPAQGGFQLRPVAKSQDAEREAKPAPQKSKKSKKKHAKRPRYAGPCEETAANQREACASEARDDYYVARAVCLNVSDEEERAECFEEAQDEYAEAGEECAEQQEAREDLCDALGQGRYDPSFEPEDFDSDFSALTNPNPYFPLAIGNQWSFEGAETIEIVVRDATKSIEGVNCVVVNDRVEEDGLVVEDTDDWFGQRLDGTVDYCGESTMDFEFFPGDQPPLPELVEIEGSFKHGRDGDKAGTQMPAVPVVGQVYRQEWSPGNAEDAAIVLSTTYGYGSDAELDEHVPAALAQLLCAANDCLVTGEFTPIEPDSFERKYYARGIGLFLEVNPEDGEIVQLVDCNFDARCAALPAP
jgi:hypothetical protein